MMSYAGDPRSLFQRLSDLWQQWRSPEEPVSRLVQRPVRTFPQPAEQPKAIKPHSAKYWRRMEAEYRDRIANFANNDRLKDYYESEANLCAAEAKKIEDAEVE